MISIVHYTPELPQSDQLVELCLPSLKTMGWNPVLQEGYTPFTAPDHPIMKSSFLSKDTGMKQRTKFACAMNHYRFWQRVVEAGERMTFIEHDVSAVRPPIAAEFELEYLAAAFISPMHRGQNRFIHAFRGGTPGTYALKDLPYTLKYPNANPYFCGFFLPNTAAYSCSPSAARKLIAAFEEYGAERSDAQINTNVVEIGVRLPGAFNYLTNPNTSSGDFWTEEGAVRE